MERERQQRRLVRPIFEQPPLPLRAPGGAVEQGAIIAAEAREGRQIMGAGEDVDAVDLVQAEPGDGAGEMAGGHRRRAGDAEALRGERDPPGGGEAEAFGSGAHRRSRAERAPAAQAWMTWRRRPDSKG